MPLPAVPNFFPNSFQGPNSLPWAALVPHLDVSRKAKADFPAGNGILRGKNSCGAPRKLEFQKKNPKFLSLGQETPHFNDLQSEEEINSMFSYVEKIFLRKLFEKIKMQKKMNGKTVFYLKKKKKLASNLPFQFSLVCRAQAQSPCQVDPGEQAASSAFFGCLTQFWGRCFPLGTEVTSELQNETAELVFGNPQIMAAAWGCRGCSR